MFIRNIRVTLNGQEVPFDRYDLVNMEDKKIIFSEDGRLLQTDNTSESGRLESTSKTEDFVKEEEELEDLTKSLEHIESEKKDICENFFPKLLGELIMNSNGIPDFKEIAVHPVC